MPYWSPFFEIRHDEHFDSIANAFVPVEGKILILAKLVEQY